MGKKKYAGLTRSNQTIDVYVRNLWIYLHIQNQCQLITNTEMDPIIGLNFHRQVNYPYLLIKKGDTSSCVDFYNTNQIAYSLLFQCRVKQNNSGIDVKFPPIKYYINIYIMLTLFEDTVFTNSKPWRSASYILWYFYVYRKWHIIFLWSSAFQVQRRKLVCIYVRKSVILMQADAATGSKTNNWTTRCPVNIKLDIKSWFIRVQAGQLWIIYAWFVVCSIQ